MTSSTSAPPRARRGLPNAWSGSTVTSATRYWGRLISRAYPSLAKSTRLKVLVNDLGEDPLAVADHDELARGVPLGAVACVPGVVV